MLSGIVPIIVVWLLGHLVEMDIVSVMMTVLLIIGMKVRGLNFGIILRWSVESILPLITRKTLTSVVRVEVGI